MGGGGGGEGGGGIRYHSFFVYLRLFVSSMVRLQCRNKYLQFHEFGI